MKGKTKMKKIITMILAFALLINTYFSFCACSDKTVTDINNVTDKTANNSNSLGSFSASDVRSLTVPEFDTEGHETEDVDFTVSNTMVFDTVSIEKFFDDSIISIIEATNNGNDTVTNIKIYVSVLDISNVEHVASYATCDYAAESNKKVSIKGIFEGVSKETADSIIVTAYEYTLQGQRHHVDLINNTAVKWDIDTGNSDFEKNNALSFSFEPTGTKNSSYHFDATVHNNSDYDIRVVEFRIIFLDSENNQLYEMNGYTMDLAAGSTNTDKLSSIDLDNEILSKISKIGVSSYSYWFTEDNVDKYKGYKVDLISSTSTGLTS